LNDYSRGAFEALSWARKLTRKCKSLEEVEKRLDEALNRMKAGSALEFSERIMLLPED